MNISTSDNCGYLGILTPIFQGNQIGSCKFCSELDLEWSGRVMATSFIVKGDVWFPLANNEPRQTCSLNLRPFIAPIL